MKLTNNFWLQEFVPRSMYRKWGDNSTWFIDDRIPKLAQFVRDRYKVPIIINNWHYQKEGVYNFRGYRPANTSVGAKKSQHKFGRAFDFNCKIPLKEIFADILLNKELFMKKGLRAVENIERSVTWIHMDVRHHFGDDLIIF
tara:strand:- start:150 stop:575 length:426 start_codon:yes stop_codon:yes gene_type:complete